MSGLSTDIKGTLTAKNAMQVSDSPFGAGLYPLWHTTDGSNSYFFCGGDISGNMSAFYKGSTKITAYTGNDYDPSGMVFYNGFVYLAYANSVAEYNVSSGAVTMSKFSLTSTGSSTIFSPMLVGTDDILYIGYRQYVASYDGSTYTDRVLTLPNNRSVVCMVEYGDNILIATYGGNKTIIYSWDRQSNFADIWSIIEDSPVRSMVVHNNIVYILTGFKLTLWQSVGTQVSKICTFTDFQRSKMRLDDINMSSYYYNIGRYGIQSMVAQGSKLFISIPAVQNSGVYPSGIWSFDTDTGALKPEYNFYDYNNFVASQSDVRIITLLLPSHSNIVYYQADRIDNAFFIKGVSVSNGFNGYKNNTYNQYYESPIYAVGTTDNKRTFNTLSVQLSEPILSDEGLRISYRKNRGGAWILLGEINIAGQLSKSFNFGVTCEYIQIKVEFKSGSTYLGDADNYFGYPYPLLKAIIIR